MTVITQGLICSLGSLPAERTWISPSERSLTRPAAIWLRPELWTQTNRTSGISLVIAALRLREGDEALAGEAVCETGTKTLIFESLSRSVESAM